MCYGLEDISGVKHNYAYFPIFVDADAYGMTRDELYARMKEKGILGRRYFYPLISNLSIYRDLETAEPSHLPVANRIADSVICLPMYAGLTKEEVDKVLSAIVK